MRKIFHFIPSNGIRNVIPQSPSIVVVVVKWSLGSPNTPKIQIRIPLQPTAFSVKFVFEKNDNKQRESGVGPFKNKNYSFAVLVPVCGCYLDEGFYSKRVRERRGFFSNFATALKNTIFSEILITFLRGKLSRTCYFFYPFFVVNKGQCRR